MNTEIDELLTSLHKIVDMQNDILVELLISRYQDANGSDLDLEEL